MGKMTRAEKAGIAMADAIIEMVHLTYNASRAREILGACIRRIADRSSEIQPKKADPAYKEARYGKKKP